ncbi:MAG: hypothetical protein E7027_05135 [Elusimicrobium sp.]|uniref:Uncharacterized protein n=1 Tax=Candidatus Avelusimicrobium gallicola TaxID=2562704 RepID=A0A928HIY3_9BACT|nr:hypothetical protein [Elusimicrobium sp.]
MKIKQILVLLFLFVCSPMLAVSQELSALEQSISAAAEKAMQNQNDETLVQLGYKMAKEKCPYDPFECTRDIIFKAEYEAGGDILQAFVCDEKENGVCLTALAFARGGIRYALEQTYWKGKPIKEVGSVVSALVTEYGVQSEKDAEMATKYFYDLLKDAHKDCDSGFSIDYGSAAHRADQRQARERKSNNCASEVAGLSAIAMLAQNATEKNEAADKIYDLLEDTYSSSAAGIVIPGCISALAVLDTQKSFSLIEKFLLDETIPTTAGDVLHSVSLSGVARGALRGVNNLRGGDSRYLNRINESFQYLDKDEARRQGHKSMEAYQAQYPQGNLLEDVGYMLGELSKENPRAQALSKKIINKANEYAIEDTHAAGRIHYPVVLGIMSGLRKHGNTFIYLPKPELLNLFYKGDWWDINEGTQRRVHYVAQQFAKQRGYTWKEPAKDPEKHERYVYNARLLNMGEVGDMVVSAVSMGALVVSLPAMAKGLAGCVRALTSRTTWMKGGKQLLDLQRKVRQRVASPSVRGARASSARPSSASAGVSSKTTVPATKAASTTGNGAPRVAATPKQKVKTPAAKPSSAAKPAASTKPTSGNAKPAAATAAEKTSAAPTRAQIESELTGPLSERVQTAQVKASSYAERSLMPKATGKQTGHYVARSDNLVYVESHPTDPTKAVFYYADDMGSVVSPKEVPMAQYDALMSSMSAAEKNMFARGQSVYSDVIATARTTREYDRLDDLARQIKNLRTKRNDIIKARPHVADDPAHFAQIRKIDSELAALQKEASRTIKDMSKNGMGNERTLAQMFEYELETFTATAKPRASTLSYANRGGLMPKASGKPTGEFKPLPDNLVYVESHPTDPTKAVFYYADDMGKAVTPKEVPMAQYDAMMSSMSAAEKNMLARAGDLYADVIGTARQEKEFTRLNDLARQIKGLRSQRADIIRAKAHVADDPAHFAQIRQIDNQISALTQEATRTIKDMSKNGMGNERTLAQMFEYELETFTATAKPRASTLSYANRGGLMPKASGKPTGEFKPLPDNLVYMESHPTDPTKAVFYYADDMGKAVTPKEVPMTRYHELMGSMSAAEKNMLARAGDLYADVIGTARKEKEFARLDQMAEQLNTLRAQRQQIASSPNTYVWGEGDNFARIRQIDQQIAQLEGQSNMLIRDMASNKLGTESSLRSYFQMNLKTPTPTRTAAARPQRWKYNDRSLMPDVPKNAQETGLFELRSDGLVYMERHPTDPTKALFYYADDAGKVSPKELPMKEYVGFMDDLTMPQKANLQHAAQVYGQEISAARVNVEYNRLDALGKQLGKLRQYEAYLRSKSVGSADDFKKIKEVQKQISSLETEARLTVREMVDNKMGTEKTLMQILQYAQETEVAATAVPRAAVTISSNAEKAHEQLASIAKQIGKLEKKRISLAQKPFSQAIAKEIREIDDQIRLLSADGSSVISQMVKQDMGNQRTLEFLFKEWKEAV